MFYEHLTPPQLQAVESLNGPLLILAGAGSGKTQAITYRIAHLVVTGEATPGQILAVTFTNKAAREMESRARALLRSMNVESLESPWISTFHSLCSRILRQYIHLLGYQPSFVIYNDFNQLSVIKKILRKLNIDERIYNPKNIKSKVNTAKNLSLGPLQVADQVPNLMDDRDLLIYSEYEEVMKASNALDFSDLLCKTYQLFEEHPEVLKVFQEKFRYIMVDEYQDTNHIQYLLVKTLSGARKNICVVGDEDQSIYSWRGADIKNILDFEKDFPGTKIIKLEENHRSTKNIVEAASGLISHNCQRKDKVLFTSRSQGDPIVVRGQSSDHEEAKYVVQTISSLVGKGAAYKDCVIFYRTNAQSRVFEDQLRHRSIPYKLIGGIKFYDRKEIKDILGYMQLAWNPKDDMVARRIINIPTRGIGRVTLGFLEGFSQQNGVSWLEACRLSSESGQLSKGICAKLRTFYDLMEELRCQVHNSDSPRLSEIYHSVLNLTDYERRLREENTVESLARIDNLEEFNNVILQFQEEEGEEATLPNFLEKMALFSDDYKKDHHEDAVTLMTLHVSKGLEYPNVFMVGMEEGLFPTGQSIEKTMGRVEEERRLAYVGMTRAKERLFFSYARMRKIWGKDRSHRPSRFLKEIPEKYVKWEDPLLQRKLHFMKDRIQNERNNSPESVTNDFNSGYKIAYKKGMRVRHPTFGEGSICRLEGRGEKLKVSIIFSNKRIRKFVAKYTSLEQLY